MVLQNGLSHWKPRRNGILSLYTTNSPMGKCPPGDIVIYWHQPPLIRPKPLILSRVESMYELLKELHT